MKPLVVGAGNDLRGDDAAGLQTARRVRSLAGPTIDVLEASGDLTDLAAQWAGRERVIVIDAARSGARCGSVHRLDGAIDPLGEAFPGASTHGFGLAGAVELARALGRLPPSLVIYGIEGRTFEAGAALSPEVARSVEALAARIARECAGA